MAEDKYFEGIQRAIRFHLNPELSETFLQMSNEYENECYAYRLMIHDNDEK